MALLAVVIGAGPVEAQRSKNFGPLRVTLRQAIELARSGHPAFQSAELKSEAASLDIAAAAQPFDTTLTFELGGLHEHAPIAESDRPMVEARAFDGSLGVQQRFAPG